MSNLADATTPVWDISQARNLYNIQRWGAKYFDINDAGHVVVSPQQDAGSFLKPIKTYLGRDMEPNSAHTIETRVSTPFATRVILPKTKE